MLDLSAELEALRDHYIERLNALLDRGREDLAKQLADDYYDEAAELMCRLAPAS